MTTDPDKIVFDNPFSNIGDLEEDAFLLVPGVVNTSQHALRTGRKKSYYIDVDALLNDPVEGRTVVEWYSEKIREISFARRADVLGIIEKGRDSGGTIGAIQISVALSMETGIPNLPIRLGKEMPSERIKLRTTSKLPVSYSLKGLNFLVITDHCTSGDEVQTAVEAVRYRGASVSDVLTYSIIRSEFDNNSFFQEEPAIHVHYRINAPGDLEALGLNLAHTETGK